MLSRSLKIGIVCPYSWDTPGGVQNHIRDLAEFLIESGHDVSVLAPVIDESNLPEYVVNAGKPISIPYNGAVARVLFGPVAFARVRQWISQGEFDLLHLHEPAIPSISLLACWAADGPMVGTFHAAAKRQKIIFAIGPILEPAIEKLSARIAVSEAARLTLTDHLDTDAVIIPNGIYANRYTDGKTIEKWSGNTIGFIGRFEEPRKGLSVLVDALPGESFGIILAEALAGGACVVASDIPAFDDLLGHGEFGALFESESSTELAKVVIDLLRDETKRKELSARGKERSKKFDWTVVAQQIYSVYEMSIVGSQKVRLASDTRPWNRFLSKEEKQQVGQILMCFCKKELLSRWKSHTAILQILHHQCC